MRVYIALYYYIIVHRTTEEKVYFVFFFCRHWRPLAHIDGGGGEIHTQYIYINTLITR